MNGMPNIPNISLPSLINGGISFGGAALINGIFNKKVWGVVNQYGIPVLLADSFVSASFDSGSQISDYPIEGGTFASYNKVDEPNIATVQLNKSTGGELQRGLFITQVEMLKKSTLKFHIITPEYVYLNYQITGTSVSRSGQDGLTLLKMNLDLREVREVKVKYDIEEVAEQSDSNTKDGGAKESKPVRESIAYRIFGGL